MGPKRYDHELRILLGITLLLNPFVVGALDIGDPDWYHYEASTVEFHANGTYNAPSEVDQLDSEVACLGRLPSRACTLERAIHAQGGIVYHGPPPGFLHTTYEYVYVWREGFFTPTGTEQNGTMRYGLGPISNDDALTDVATPIGDARTGIKDAIRNGQFETSDQLQGANELVVANGTYYVVHLTRAHVDNGAERTRGVIAMQWIVGTVGGYLVLTGRHHTPPE